LAFLACEFAKVAASSPICAFAFASCATFCGETDVGVFGVVSGGFGTDLSIGSGSLSLLHDLQELNVVSVVPSKTNAASIAIVFFIFAVLQEGFEVVC
jgi:hypothetical protein